MKYRATSGAAMTLFSVIYKMRFVAKFGDL
jgi:hypothetical protein